MSHGNACQRATSAEEGFSDQVDRMTHPISAEWANECSGNGGNDGCYAWAQKHALLVTMADLEKSTA